MVAGAAAQRMTSRLVAAVGRKAGCFLAFLKFTVPMFVATGKAGQHAVHCGIENAVWGH